MKIDNNYEAKSLAQLNKKYQPPKEVDFPSGLIMRHTALLAKPIGAYTIEDLRLMIGQNTGLESLMPKAIEVLEKDVLAEGDYYEGDLLKAVLTSDKNFWLKHGSLCRELIEVIESQLQYLLDYPIDDKAKMELIEAYQKFKMRNQNYGVPA
ncbi:MAG: contact-dependent growth inhibition system immunity protein [Saprospiraceae bacterium]